MKKRAIQALVVGVLVVVGWFGYVQLRFLLFTMEARRTVEKLGRFPTAQRIIDLPGAIKADAQKYHVPLETLTVKVEIEGRAAGPVRFYFVVLKVQDGSRTYKFDDARLESQEQVLAEEENLKQHGIELRR